MLTPRTRGNTPYVASKKYIPADGEVIRVEDHILVLNYTFVGKMNKFYDDHVDYARPGDPANTGRRADARDFRAIVQRCYYAPPDSTDVVVDSGRIAFRHPAFPGYLFIAVLEGVTEHRLRGELTFISLIYERKPAADRRVEMYAVPAVDWPPPDCPKTEALHRLERGRIALDLWIKMAPDRHPKLDDAYAARRSVIVEIDRLLRLPDEEWMTPFEEGIFDNEESE